MLKFQRSAKDNNNLELPPSPINDFVDRDEVDRASHSVFDPNSTSTSVWEYEDDYPDPEDYSSLPAQVALLNNLDSAYFSAVKSAHWEAEDVGDFITMLDESFTEENTPTDARMRKGNVQRPKSLYDPRPTTSFEDSGLMVVNGERWEPDDQTHLSPIEISELEGNSRRLWMASTEELMLLNNDSEYGIGRRATTAAESAALSTSTATEDNLLSLENSFCELGSSRSVQVAEAAESDLQSIRKLLNNVNDTGGISCPSCKLPFDKGKKRKLIDTCGHERCFSCMFKNEMCPICCSPPSDNRSSSMPSGSDIYKTPNETSHGQTRCGSSSRFLQKGRDQKDSNWASGKSSSSFGKEGQSYRRFFSPKSLKSPFNKRRSDHHESAGAQNLLPSDEEDLGSFQYRSPVVHGLVDANEDTADSYKSLASANISPVSTLTGSSDAEMCRVLQDSGVYTVGSTSIGSMMSMSISEKSTASLSPTVRRHSLSTGNSSSDQTGPFRKRMVSGRRSTRLGATTTTATIDQSSEGSRPTWTPNSAPQLTLKPLFFEVPTQELEPKFGGRHWLLRDISNTLSHADSQGVLIQGGPGAGKTAFCLQLVDYSCFGRRRNSPTADPDDVYNNKNVTHDRFRDLASHVVAYHFCQADNNATCLVPDFIHSLAAQLCQAPQLSAYRDYLLGEAHLQNLLSVKECIADPGRAMKMGILEPLISLRKTGNIASNMCVLLVDGLCEAEYHRPDQGDTIASFLARMVPHFPSWLKIVGTVRTQMMEFVKLTALPRFNLDGNSDSVQKDVYDYCNQRINESAAIQTNIQVPGESLFSVQTKFVQYLMNLAKGSFLFVKMSLDLIEGGHLKIKSNTFKVVPVSLSQVFLLKFNLKFSTTHKFERVVNVLNICLATLYPLTRTEIFYTLNAMQAQTAIPWTEFLDIFADLSDVLVKRSDGTYMFFHPSLREWLIRRDANESTKFLCDTRIGHVAIAFRLSRIQAPLDSDLILELGHHILKAHIYRNSSTGILPRDIQAFWLVNVAQRIESSLCTLRNMYSPNIKVSRLLLLAGASPNYKTEILGNAPLLLVAASEGITPMVNLLLEFGADVDGTNSQGSTALILAAAKGYHDVVRNLVAGGASLGHTDNSMRCALVHAARAGHLSVLKYLLSCDWSNKCQANHATLEEAVQQALVCASAEGCCEAVEELLEASPTQIDEQDSVTGDTALVAAARSGHMDVITCLLARSALVSGVNKRHVNALIAASREGNLMVAERLLQFSAAGLNQKDDEGKTALIYASQENHIAILSLLLAQKEIDTEVADNEGMTALSWSCLRGHLSAATVLLDNSANIQHTDNTGRTPLDLAAYQGSAGLAQLLIERGSTLEHVDLNGMRPLDRAIACRNLQIVPVFLKKGAKLGPATWEMARGKPEILLLLLNKLLEDGNTLYRKTRLQEASHRYQYALKKFPASATDHKDTFTQLKINFLLNFSRCSRKMNNIAQAIDMASEAIQLNPKNYEGYHLRAKSYAELPDFEMALRDSKTALKLSQKGASGEIRAILIRYHDEVTRMQERQDPKITEL